MNILITGSSGQIGTNVGLALIERGDTVLGVDIRPNQWTDKIETVTADLSRSSFADLPAGSAFDMVLHLAAHAKVYELVEKPERAMENIAMTFTMLEYCRRNALPLIFSSSREVYGDIHQHVTDESCADFVVAESPYSASKISGEALIYSYAECYSLPYLVFRFSNVYGRYDNDLERMERVIPLFMDRIARDQPLTIYGREKVLDFTYVDDCVRGVIAGIDALAQRRVVAQTINLAFGEGRTLVDLVNILSLGLGKEPNVTYEPTRPGEVTRYVADIRKAQELLDYRPQVPFSEGLVRAIKWARSTGAVS